MRKRPKMPASTPTTRPERAEVPARGIRVTLSTISHSITIQGWVSRFSVTGMFVETHEPLPDDTEVCIELDTRYSSRPYHLELLGWVVHYQTHGLGIQFDQETVAANPVLAELVTVYRRTSEPEPV